MAAQKRNANIPLRRKSQLSQHFVYQQEENKLVLSEKMTCVAELAVASS